MLQNNHRCIFRLNRLLYYHSLNKIAPGGTPISFVSPHIQSRNFRPIRDVLKLHAPGFKWLWMTKMTISLLVQHRTCGIICSSQSGPATSVIFLNPY